MCKQVKNTDEKLQLDKSYKDFLQGIKERLRTAQMRAALAANKELIKFYWELGSELIEKQKAYNWGDHFLDQISHDIKKAFPKMQGFSKRNLQRMRQFAQLYPNLQIAPQAVAQLPWGHISFLIHKIKDNKIRDWYAQQTIQYGWSRSVLSMQVESELYNRQSDINKKVTNYQEHLPASQSDLANEMLKDPYNFDFLTIQGEAHERLIELGLIAHMRDFLLELGKGFAFVGSQVPLIYLMIRNFLLICFFIICICGAMLSSN